MKIKIDSLDTIHEAAKEFLQNMGDGKVFAFYGKMGAGKTTFVKAICEELGVEDVITSPTFALVNEYTAGDGSPVYHFDFYRIKKLDEVYDMGYEDYFYSGNLCFLEWPELIEDLLPEDCTKVTITADMKLGIVLVINGIGLKLFDVYMRKKHGLQVVDLSDTADIHELRKSMTPEQRRLHAQDCPFKGSECCGGTNQSCTFQSGGLRTVTTEGKKI